MNATLAVTAATSGIKGNGCFEEGMGWPRTAGLAGEHSLGMMINMSRNYTDFLVFASQLAAIFSKLLFISKLRTRLGSVI
jgi:hypothetical protein